MVQYAEGLDAAFAAVADSTRRGILERLGRGDASITELADAFDMTLTGIKKHVGVLEHARLVTTRKTGRVRTCAIGPHRLSREAKWIEKLQRVMDARFDRLQALLDDTQD